MKAVFYCIYTDKVCTALVRILDGRLFIDRATLRRLFKRLSCEDVNKIFCDRTVFYSYPTLGRPNKEYKNFLVY